MYVKVTRMERERHAGDWHDKPLRWQVTGPDSELQQFSTKRDATLYARIRRRSRDFNSASNEYVRLA